jgi:hypothetical protein
MFGIIFAVKPQLNDDNPHKNNIGYAGLTIFLVGFILLVVGLGFHFKGK